MLADYSTVGARRVGRDFMCDVEVARETSIVKSSGGGYCKRYCKRVL